MKKVFTAALCSVMAVSLAACGGGTGSTDTGGTSDSGGTGGDNYVTLAKENDVISMNTTYATDGMSFEMIAATIEGLETMDKDGKVIPGIAESYEESEDGLTYTFKLRDAEWSNGDPVTASDFVFAWNYAVKNPENEYSYLFTDDGACVKNANEIVFDQKDEELAIKAVDDKTFEVQLDKKCPFFLSLMTFPQFYPINEKFFKEQGDKYALTPDALLANGPYKLVEWTKGTSLKFDKNATYWDADNVNVDGINVNIVPEASTSALDFESGNTDFTKLNSTLVDKYKDSPEYATILDGYLWYLQFNLNNKDLQNVNLRKAIGTVIDRDNLVNNVLKDGSIAKGGFMPEAFAVNAEGEDYAATEKAFYDKVGDDAVKAAQEYFDKAKKELGKDKITLRLLYEPADPAKPAAEFIQSELKKLDGLEIEMVSQEKENRIELQKARDFDIVLTRWGPDYADPTTYLNLMITGNSYNYGDYSNKEYDEKMKEAADAKTDEERWKLLHEAEEILMEDSPVIGVFQVGGASLIADNVTGIENHSFGVPYLYKNLKKTAE